jgi:hypothetical protein
VKVSVSGSTTTLACLGTTTSTQPIVTQKTTKCDGETLAGTAAPEGSAPLHGCSITLGSTTVLTDDWIEIITTKGDVKILCKSSGSDTN